MSALKKPIPLGGGREFEVTVDRFDDLQSPITIDADQIPEGLITNLPLIIEPGQRFAQGILWVDADDSTPLDPRLMSDGVTLSLTARAEAAGRTLERTVGQVGPLKVGPRTKATPMILPSDPSGLESGAGDAESALGPYACIEVKRSRLAWLSNETQSLLAKFASAKSSQAATCNMVFTSTTSG